MSGEQQDLLVRQECPPRGFAPEEFDGRVGRAQRLMAESGIDALLLTTEPEVRYFSGFLTQFWQSPTRPWFLVVPSTGKPIAVIPAIGVPLMERTWIDDVRSWQSPNPEDEGISLLSGVFSELGASAGTIGVAMGPETSLRMPLKDYFRLTESLRGARFLDASDILRRLRMVKSEAEIAKIAHICGIASNGFEAVSGLVSVGQPLPEVFRSFKCELLRQGADDVPYLVGAADHGGYSDVISPPTDRALKEGDILMMDTGAMHDGYFCDFDRNFAIGSADDSAKRAYDALFLATEAGLEEARPGATCADLFRAMQEAIIGAGYQCGSVGRLGHGLGMQITEHPSHAAWDRTVLEPGMVLTLEPCLTIAPGKEMVHEENIVIRENGAELLTRRASADLPVIG